MTTDQSLGGYSDDMVYYDDEHNSPFPEQETGPGLTDLRTSQFRKVCYPLIYILCLVALTNQESRTIEIK